MHLDPDRWSRGTSWLHRRDARAKVILLLIVLVWIGTTLRPAPYLALILAGALAARLPLTGVAARAALVLPFTITFAVVSIIGGDWDRAQMVFTKSLLSAASVVVITGATPMAALFDAAAALGAPRLLITVTQFLYRYLFVLADEAARMRWAAASRGGFRWNAAGGAVAGLFGSSYGRAEAIHRAMLARGFDGRLHGPANGALHAADYALLAGISVLLIAGRLVWGF